MKDQKRYKVIISGGGTGGHIFPAISIANEIRKREPETEILFVGAEGRMEMEKVPAAGYKIVGLPVLGFKRKLIYKNLNVLFQLRKSLKKANQLIEDFKPDVVVGVGGYASGPILREAARKGIPTLIQEQNSYAGITNRLLAKRARKICVAYEGMDKYFPKEKIVLTGNPVREILLDTAKLTLKGKETFEMDPDLPVLLILGGSLGAGTINQSVTESLELLLRPGIQVIWQTGSNYYKEAKNAIARLDVKNIRVFDFIGKMELAYAAADVIVSRAGAGTISEICLVGKPVILVPSPNVAEDHQTKNAQALVSKNAAILIPDSEAVEKLIAKAVMLLYDDEAKNQLAKNCNKMAIKDSATRIVNEVFTIIKAGN
ncbi:MAG: undecaprenyldiphospho-muramoylpentapeptide beta-N-acetylglucosaminyltransferase [Bacteroidales bacterium]|nr:undecaprenyldiphospho-muramoylpentapeptide beta-N-acetylglucosaminyltransferase [Bacteroidales bacterium]